MGTFEGDGGAKQNVKSIGFSWEYAQVQKQNKRRKIKGLGCIWLSQD